MERKNPFAIQEIQLRDRRILVRNQIPLEDYLIELGSNQGNLSVTAYTNNRMEDFDTLIGSYYSKPVYIATDGELTVVHLLLEDDLTFTDATYVAWLSLHKSKDRDPSLFYLQTSLKAHQLRKLLKNLKIKSVDFKCRALQ